ncbi:hypothetical protein [uncultured Bosea sp.]|uniref:hypothetical protein n=1 Tax=uncultured Bosea sp. TaxID=211457 RepID=UPI0025EF8AA6|nr:hypothetical protein [uncultured Bosea sp.]
MTKTNQDRGLVPLVDDGQDGGGGPLGPIRDPLAGVTDALGDDPSLAELIAFRDGAPDLTLFAREAKRCDDEAARLPYGREQTHEIQMARVGLRIVALSCTAMVAIWPTDTVADADAKRALARETRMHGDDTDYGIAPMLSVEDAARIRLHRAAFTVGDLIVPPGPVAPSMADRGLATWPLSRLDLVDALPLAGGDASLGDAQIARWAGFVDTYPTLSDLVDRFLRMIATADRLMVLAEITTEDPRRLRRAAEGARILAYLAAARAAIWPAMRYSADAEAKLRLVALVNERASRPDPLHMQAAIRHLTSEANWIAKSFRLGATLELDPEWIPIV